MFGRGGLDPEKIQKMMKQMGMKMEELSDVQEVVIKLPDKELFFPDAEVQVTKIKGQKTYQILGEAQERELETKINDEDVEMVMEQANVDKEKATSALKETDGDIAQAIVNLQGS